MDLVKDFKREIRKEKIKRVQMRKKKRKKRALNLDFIANMDYVFIV